MLFRNDKDKKDPEGDDPQGGLRVPLLPLRDIIVFPHMVVPLFVGRARSILALEDAMAGDRDQATRQNEQLQGLHEALFVEANPIPVKWAVQEMGMIGGGIRLPLTPLSLRFHDAVRQAMQQAGVVPARQ